MMAIPSDSGAYFDAVLTNTGDTRDSYTVFKEDFIPENWYAFLCLDSLCLPGDTGYVVIEPGDYTEVQIEASPSMLSGDGEIRVTVVPSSAPDSAQQIVYRIASAYPTLLLGDGSEENQYRSYYESALDHARIEYNYWDRNFSGFLYEDIINFQHILAYTGDRTSDIFSEVELDGLTAYLYQGRNLMLTGQGIASSLDGTSFLNGDIGAYYIDTYDSDPFAMGIPNDPIGDNLSFSLAGGDGANNQFEVDEIGQSSGAYPSFTYSNGPFAGVNKDIDVFHSVFLAFGLEGIDNEADRDTIVARTFDWFGATTGIDNYGIDLLPGSLSLNSYPNPFNARTNIKFSIENSADVTVTIFNVLGQRVAVLVDGHRDAGEHSVTWDASECPTGVYFARVNANGHSATMRMTLLK